jgi:hypothetical protein
MKKIKAILNWKTTFVEGSTSVRTYKHSGFLGKNFPAIEQLVNISAVALSDTEQKFG